MKLIMLMVLFSTPAEPAPHPAYGFAPRPMEDMGKCLQYRSRLQAYLEANTPGGTRFTAFCVEFHAQGYDEALDAFKRGLGAPS
jgi:hypothetical protein